MTRMPGPLRRLGRHRMRLAALVLVALTPLAASGMEATASLVLQQTLDGNWRGSYDLLVTARTEDPVTAGLLRPDTLVDSATGRLSMADLALIRSLPGVAVAAPVTLVSFSASNVLSDPLVWVPVPVRPDSDLVRPQAFRVTVTSSYDDGTGVRQLTPVQLLAFSYAPQEGEVILGTDGLVLRTSDGRTAYADSTLADRPRLLSADTRSPFMAGNYDPDAAAVPLGLFLSPRPAGVITLVDPESERELLGEAGAFLDPLIAAQADPDIIPVITLDRPQSPLTLGVTVEEFDSPVPADRAGPDSEPFGYLQYGTLAPRLASGSGAHVVASYTVDASPALEPFARDLLVLGSLDAASIGRFVDDYTEPVGPGPRSVLQPRYVVPEDVAATGTGVELAPRGYVAGRQYVEAPLSRGAPLGSVTEYSKVFNSLTVGLTDAERSLEGRIRVVGSYDRADLAPVTSAAGYVPLGGYDTASPSLVTDADGTTIAPVPLATSLTGYGIPGTNTMAIGSIAMLQRWGVDRPITSIRVRLSGIDDYTPEAQKKLLDAVVALRALGFTATVMAGSSPQTLPVQVTGYASAELDEQGLQRIADLGAIEQRWSRFGAVVEAQVGVSATSVALLALATASVGAILAAVQLGSIPVRRRTTALLSEQGWRRRRVALWFAGEEAVALAVLVVLGGVAVVVTTVPVVAAASAAVAVGLVLSTSVVAVTAGVRPSRATRVRAVRSPVSSPVGFGVRRALANPAATVSLLAAVLLVCAIVAMGATVFIEGRRAAGPSDLGALASLRALLPQGVLVAVGLLAAGLLARLARGIRAERDRAQLGALRAMGWSRGARTAAAVAESSVAVVPAVVVGIAASALITAQSSPGALGAVVVASLVAGLVALAVVIDSDRRLD